VLGTCISAGGELAVVDVGLKALSVDHGPPAVDGADVVLVSDEHLTIRAAGAPLPRPGDRVTVWPSHVDPTVALHEQLHVVDDEAVLEVWPVDLRGW
jgi:D-serine deaminase-like pyridoxal phosphate-dependent protein